MRTYNGYTYETLLDEYAVRVYSLCLEGARRDAELQLQAIQAASLPHADKEAYDNAIQEYEYLAGFTMTDNEADDDATDKLLAILGN